MRVWRGSLLLLLALACGGNSFYDVGDLGQLGAAGRPAPLPAGNGTGGAATGPSRGGSASTLGGGSAEPAGGTPSSVGASASTGGTGLSGSSGQVGSELFCAVARYDTSQNYCACRSLPPFDIHSEELREECRSEGVNHCFVVPPRDNGVPPHCFCGRYSCVDVGTSCGCQFDSTVYEVLPPDAADTCEPTADRPHCCVVKPEADYYGASYGTCQCRLAPCDASEQEMPTCTPQDGRPRPAPVPHQCITLTESCSASDLQVLTICNEAVP